MDGAKQMIATVRELRVSFLAGSIISLAATDADRGIAPGDAIAESLGLFYLQVYGLHNADRGHVDAARADSSDPT